MPLLKIQTNVTVEAQRGDQLMKTASEQVATLLGKPEGFVMVVLETDVQMLFGGTPEPLAYLELKSIGLPQQQTGELSAQLCRLVGGTRRSSLHRVCRRGAQHVGLERQDLRALSRCVLQGEGFATAC